MERKVINRRKYLGGDEEEFILDIENSQPLEEIVIGQGCYIKVPGNLDANICKVGEGSRLHIKAKHTGQKTGPILGFVHENSDKF